MREVRFAPALTSRRINAGLLGGAVLVADQISKLWARTALADHDLVIIPGWFRLAVTENSGAAFSLFQGYGAWLGLAALLVAFLILVAVERTRSTTELVGLGLVLGGAIGNLGDRIFRGPWLSGAVTDFIDFSFWPTFNLADSAITVGVVILVWAARRT